MVRGKRSLREAVNRWRRALVSRTRCSALAGPKIASRMAAPPLPSPSPTAWRRANDRGGDTRIRNAVCGGLGGARRQRLSRSVASGRFAAHAAGQPTGRGQRTRPAVAGADRGGAGFRLAIAGLDLARRGGDHRVADHRLVNGARFSWRGVDKFRIKAGKIIEERVYCDTAPLRALRSGEALEPITQF